MIYIKTEMKEMPKNCGYCTMKHMNVGCRIKAVATCAATIDFDANRGYRPIIKDCLSDTRPEWCPLVEIKEADK